MAELIGELLAAIIEPLLGLIVEGIKLVGALLAVVVEGIVYLILPGEKSKSK